MTGLTAGLNFKGLVSGDQNKSPKSSSLIGDGLKNAMSQSMVKPESKSKIGFGTSKSNLRGGGGLTPKKGAEKKE